MQIEISDGQANSLISFIDDNLIQNIRDDEDIDNMEYVCNICEFYRKLKESKNNEKL